MINAAIPGKIIIPVALPSKLQIVKESSPLCIKVLIPRLITIIAGQKNLFFNMAKLKI